MAKTASTPGRRFMKLAGMTASIAGKTLSNSIKNLTADEEQKNTARSKLFQDIGIQIADTLFSTRSCQSHCQIATSGTAHAI